MRLLSKTQAYYFGLFSVLLIVWSGLFLVTISYVLKDSIDETIASELRATLISLNNNEDTIKQYAKGNPLFEVHEIEKKIPVKFAYSDTVLYDPVEQEDIPYRKLKTQIRTQERFVEVSLLKSKVEYEDLFSAIFFTELALIFLLFVGMYWLNKGILEKIWQPFFTTLQKVSEFRVNKSTQLILPETNIQEFKKLNLVLEEMMDQIKQDYESLKQFTENASHEIQTPLAIITSRIEVLLQENKLEENGWNSLKEIYEAAGRLSRLNKALLLLTKIENRQFNSSETIDLGEILVSLLPVYEEQVIQKRLTVTSNIQEAIQVNANLELIRVLLRNLISNSIRHNTEGGEILIQLNSDDLIISNSGIDDGTDPEKYFDRFYKKSNNPHSLGLGLAIVKEICELHGFAYNYTIEDQRHIVNIEFKVSKAEQ